MTEGKSYYPWPRTDDRIVVQEMLRDLQSEQWYECYVFINKLVHAQAKNIPIDHRDDIVQETMFRVHKYLSAFQYQCKFRTWLFGIVRSCIIDDYRKFMRARQFIVSIGELYDDDEYEDHACTNYITETVEDEYITHDELNKALAALQEYVSIHANPLRNGRILDIVIFEGRSLEEAAKVVGCSAAVVSYFVRSSQHYVREKFSIQR